MNKYLAFWRNYFNFSGRSTRSEFWIPFLVNAIIIDIFANIYNNDHSSPLNIIGLLFVLAIIIPQMALIVRRVRGTGTRNIVLWSILGIIIQLIAVIFGFFRTDGLKK